MSVEHLYLLGTLHDDLLGVERLRGHLDFLSPDIITMESNADDPAGPLSEEVVERVTERAMRGIHPSVGATQRHELQQLYETWLRAVNFERATVDAYAADRGLSPHYIEHPNFDEIVAIDHDKRLNDQLRFLRQFGTATEYQRYQDRLYQRTLDAYQRGTSVSMIDIDADHEQGLVGPRDRYMGERIRTSVKQYPDARVVHVGGAYHFLGQENTLYTALKDLDPKRVLIAELPGTPGI